MSPLIGYDTAGADFVVPADAQWVLGYTDGLYVNIGAAARRFPGLAKLGRVIGLSVHGNPAEGLDIEPGNVGPNSAVPFVQTMHARGVKRPWLYADQSDMRTVIQDLNGVGIQLGPAGPNRPVRLHVAHPNGIQHVCGPTTCGFGIEADATQFWWSSIQGRWHGFPGDLDVSLARDDAFPGPQPQPPPQGVEMVAAVANHDGRLEVFVETPDGNVWHTWQEQPGQGFRSDPTTHKIQWSNLGKPS